MSKDDSGGSGGSSGGVGAELALGKRGHWVPGSVDGRPRPVVFLCFLRSGTLEFLTLCEKAQTGGLVVAFSPEKTTVPSLPLAFISFLRCCHFSDGPDLPGEY